MEAETGLYFYNARWYDPALGRFLQADSVVPQPGNPLAWDRYAYSRNSPLRYSDPLGHIPILIIGGITLMKAIDYGWIAYDAYQSSQVLADPNAPQSAKDLAAAILALTISFELAEPDDVLPISLPLDDFARRWIINATESQLDEVVKGGAHIIDDLPDNALVCRGGICTADRFAGGSGVTVNPDGTLLGVSVNSAPRASFEDLTITIPNR
ncbi:MAG: RHS repeat-associated core domain-containing protein [Bacteroidales bacterium]